MKTFNSFIGRRVLLMTSGYYYEGTLESVGDCFIKLKDPSIVYSTGRWDEAHYEDIQRLHKDEWYVQIGQIDSFGLSKND